MYPGQLQVCSCYLTHFSSTAPTGNCREGNSEGFDKVLVTGTKTEPPAKMRKDAQPGFDPGLKTQTVTAQKMLLSSAPPCSFFWAVVPQQELPARSRGPGWSPPATPGNHCFKDDCTQIR